MSVKPHQIEERLARALALYVRACSRVRRAGLARTAADPFGPELPAAEEDRRSSLKALGNVESTFRKLGGDFDAMIRRLEPMILPVVNTPTADIIQEEESCAF